MSKINVSYYIKEFPFVSWSCQNESRFDIKGTIREKKRFKKACSLLEKSKRILREKKTKYKNNKNRKRNSRIYRFWNTSFKIQLSLEHHRNEWHRSLIWGFFNSKYHSTIWSMIEWIHGCRRTMYKSKGLTISYKQIFNYVRISAPVSMLFKIHLYRNNWNKKDVGSSV